MRKPRVSQLLLIISGVFAFWGAALMMNRVIFEGLNDASVAVMSGASSSFQAESAACLNETFPTTGTIYYVCDCQAGASPSCVSGSDSNSGLSKASPWQHWAKITQFNVLAAGDTISFCDGGQFSVTSTLQLANTNGTPSNPITIRDYLPTWGTQAPGGDGLPNAAIGSGLIGLYFNGPVNPVIPHKGVRIRNINFAGGGVAAEGIHFGNGFSNVDICNITIDNSDTAIEVANSQSLASPPGTNNVNSQQHDYYVHGCTFTNNNSEVWLGGGNNLWVNYNYMFGNSHSSGLSHGGGYFSQATDCLSYPCALFADTAYVATGEQFVGNLVYSSGRSTDTPAYLCGQAQLVFHGLHSDASILFNIFQNAPGNVNFGCYAISPTNGDPYDESFVRFLIAGNTITVWGGIGVNLGSTQFTTVENNLFLTSDASSLWAVNSGRDVGSGGDAICTNNTVVNNTAWLLGSHNSGYAMWAVGGQGVGYVIANNTAQSTAGTLPCLALDLTGSSYAAYTFLNNNNCFGPAVTWETVTGDSLSAWRAATGFDLNSFSLDPKYTTTGLGTYTTAGVFGINYVPLAGSPLIGAGNATYAPAADYNGTPRPNPPSIGAFEAAGTSSGVQVAYLLWGIALLFALASVVVARGERARDRRRLAMTDEVQAELLEAMRDPLLARFAELERRLADLPSQDKEE